MKTTLFTLIITMAGGLILADTLSDDLLTPYFTIRHSLAADTTEGISQSAGAILERTRKYLNAGEKSRDLVPMVQTLHDTAGKLRKADLAQARELFKTLSGSMIRLQEKAPGKNGAVIFYCPMAKAYWIQKTKKTANPYYGGKMLTCGKIITPRRQK